MEQRNDHELDDQLKSFLDLIREQPGRDPEVAQQGRTAFLNEFDTLRLRVNSEQAVSQPDNGRHKGWRYLFLEFQTGKERRRMVSTLITILVAIMFVFGGSGATVYAAQDSQPGEWLYPVKTWSEDVRLELPGSGQEKILLELSFADRRLSEIQALGEANQPVPSQVTERYEGQITRAMQFTGELADPAMLQVLTQVQERLQNQERTMQQWVVSGLGQQDPQFVQLQERLQERLQEQLRLVQQGLEDPQQFREKLRTRNQQETQTGTPQANPTQAQPGAGGNGNGSGAGTAIRPTSAGGYEFGPGGPDTSPEPGDGYGPGPFYPSETPQFGGGYGPGPGPADSTTQPGDGYGPGPLNPSATPMSGGGYGPGEPKVTTQPGGQGDTGSNHPLVTSEPGNQGDMTPEGGPMGTSEPGGGNNGSGGSGGGSGRP